MRRLSLLYLAALFSSVAQAALPEFPAPDVPVKTTHPYLFATGEDIAASENKLRPVLPDAGTIEIEFTPAKKIVGSPTLDSDAAVLVGSTNDLVNHFILRYHDSDTTDSVTFYLVYGTVKDGETTWGNSKAFSLPVGVPVTLVVKYDKTAVTVLANGAQKATLATPNWVPSLQRVHLVGRKNQTGGKIVVKKADQTVVWKADNYEWDAGGARYGFLENWAPSLKTKILACKDKAIAVTTDDDPCNVATGSRANITQAAKDLALAYKLTGDPTYIAAARVYVDHMEKLRGYLTPPANVKGKALGTNEEWSMAARVGAMGVLYDWFGAQLDESGIDRLSTIRNFIKETVETRTGISDAAAGNDLIRMICGYATYVPGSYNCPSAPKIDGNYISGHNATAMTGTVIGLLAIVNQAPEVKPLINTIYSHYVNGLTPVREYISADGGHQSLFFYNNVSDVFERLVLWDRALDWPDTDKPATPGFVAAAINPYIYALRNDLTYPSMGDNQSLTVDDKAISLTALASATHGNGLATTFYEQHVLPNRKRTKPAGIWDTLFFYGDRAEASELGAEPLQKRFEKSGNVFMRDTWDYAKATLLDFKSSTFSTTNHQHLDQNSFSLFHHAPLLVDSGVYDEYGSSHWYAYYSRSIAHNTIVVFDPAETFGTSYLSNDGGQKPIGAEYPTLDDIKGPPYAAAAGQNWLGGIVTSSDGERYAYVKSNASKSYGTKLDANAGFIRSILYLRSDDKQASTPPVVVVFDRINSPTKKAATFLLHTVEKPQISGTYGNIGKGRYAVSGQKNVPLVVANGTGKVTIEPLLPLAPYIKVVGGKPGDGTSCDQAPSGASGGDCRFLVRKVVSGQSTWLNYAPTKEATESAARDVGNWRIEISQVDDDVSSPTQYQFFLNVLRVGTEPTAAGQLDSQLLRGTNNSVYAVALDSRTTVGFATDDAPRDTYRWKPTAEGQQDGGTIVLAGVTPNSSFTATFQDGEWILTKDSTFNSNHLHSKADGVIEGYLTRN